MLLINVLPCYAELQDGEWVLKYEADNTELGRERSELTRSSVIMHSTAESQFRSGSEMLSTLSEAESTAERRAVEAESTAERRAVEAESTAERRAVEAERRAVEAERRAVVAEMRATEAERVAEERADRRAAEADRRAIEAEGRERNAESRTREARLAKEAAERGKAIAEEEREVAEARRQAAETNHAEESRRYREQAARLEARLALMEQRLMESEERLQHLESQWVVERREIQLTDQELGRGGWATVSVAMFRGVRVAAKCVHNQIISRYNVQLFKREMNIAARIRHPNLLQFIGATLEGELVILTELLPTSLRKELQNVSRSSHLSGIGCAQGPQLPPPDATTASRSS
jgi:hypothetical protein